MVDKLWERATGELHPTKAMRADEADRDCRCWRDRRRFAPGAFLLPQDFTRRRLHPLMNSGSGGAGGMWAMAMKEFRQMRRDRRTLAMMILLPVLLLVVFGYAASFDVDRVKTVVVGPRAEQVAAALPDRLEVVRVAPGEGRQQAV